MRDEVAFIGFGEAAMTFAADRAAAVGRFRAFDVKTEGIERDRKLSDYARLDVLGVDTPAGALRGACAAVSLVTADQALAVARTYAAMLDRGALWLDMNSVAPQTKQKACDAVEAAGGRYVDVAVMAPVRPQGRSVPLLLSGPHVDEAEGLLRRLGFDNMRQVDGGVGAASSIKMIRSVIVKGTEAVTAECLAAAQAAGVVDEVLASLDAAPSPASWRARADYTLDRILVHGLRRAAEMEEVAKTLDALGIDAVMTRGAIARLREGGNAATASVPDGLDAKLDLIVRSRRRDAA